MNAIRFPSGESVTWEMPPRVLRIDFASPPDERSREELAGRGDEEDLVALDRNHRVVTLTDQADVAGLQVHQVNLLLHSRGVRGGIRPLAPAIRVAAANEEERERILRPGEVGDLRAVVLVVRVSFFGV